MAPGIHVVMVRAVNDAPTVAVAAGVACGADDRSGTYELTLADVDDRAHARRDAERSTSRPPSPASATRWTPGAARRRSDSGG